MRGTTIGLLTVATLASALSAPASAQERAGNATAVNTETTAILPAAAVRALAPGREVFRSDRVRTNAGGTAQLLFLDSSTITIAPSSELVIDEYVFDPDQGSGKLTLQATRGILRFVGGQLSKSEPVIVRTPSATIGIRGGIGFVQVEPVSGRTTAVLGFGEMTVEARGVTRRIFKPGFAVTVGGFGQPPELPERQPASLLDELVGAVEGRVGVAGGLPVLLTQDTPTEVYVAPSNSKVAGTSAGGSGGLAASLIAGGQLSTNPLVIAGVSVRESQEAAIDDTLTPAFPSPGPPPPAPPPPAPPPPPAQQARLLAPATSYVTSTGIAVAPPGPAGLRGGDAAVDLRPIWSGGVGGALTLTSGAEVLSLPLAAGDAVVPATASPFGTLDGSSHVLADGSFFRFDLRVDGDDTRPLTIVGGTPAPASALAAAGNLRSFQLAADPGLPSTIPFARSSLLGTVSGPVAPLLHIVEPPSGSLGAGPAPTTALHASLTVTGSGAGQSTGLVLVTGQLTPGSAPGASPSFDLARRGSLLGEEDGQIALAGAVQGLATDAAGTVLMGSAAQRFVLGYDVGANGAFTDIFERPTEAALGTATGSLHTASLGGTTALASLGRTSQDLAGFSGGLASRVGRGPAELPAALRSSTGEGSFSLQLRPAENAIGARMKLAGALAGNPLATLELGFGRLDGAGSASMVDDDRFGAAENLAATRVTGDGGGRAVIGGAALYLIGQSLVDVGPLFTETATPCECSFMKWGFWGGSVDSVLDDTARTDLVHLGGWVAGTLPSIEELPTVGNATYRGHAYGEVASLTAGSVRRYTATGSMELAYDFAVRSGSLTINGFDGRSFRGEMISDNGRDFDGALTGTGAVTGAAAGSFFKGGSDPAAGAGGDWQVGSSTYRAAGIFVGKR